MAKEKITPNSIAEQLNQHKYEELKVFLRKSVDWYSLAPSSILPREQVRAFVTSIEDEEVRLAVMRFLIKYAYDYFYEVAKADTPIDFRVGISSIEDQEEEARKKVDAFQKELNFQMDLIISSGEFSGDKFHKQEEKIKELEKKVKELETENTELSAQLEKYKYPSRNGKYIPEELNKTEFYNIMNHLADKKIVRVVSEPDETGVRRIICYQWDASKALFGYFVEKMNETMNIRGARVPLNWKVFRPAINNYDEIVEEARKALSTYNNSSNLQKKRIEKAEMVEEAIEYKELPF